MKNYRIIAFAGIISASLIICSCKKKEVDGETQSVTDHALCEQEFMKIPVTVNARAVNANGVKKLIPGGSFMSNACPKDSIVGDTTGYAAGNYANLTNLPGLLLDWGTGCNDDADGVMRSGKLLTTFSKPYGQGGSVITITPVNYKVGDISYSGTIKNTRNSNTSFTIDVIDGHCSNGSWNIKWSSTRTITWIAGYGDSDETNDVMSISGSSSGVNREGREFTVNITSPLIKAASCKWIKQGALEITPNGFKTRTVDFGDGTCDNVATFSVNGNTYTFNMQ